MCLYHNTNHQNKPLEDACETTCQSDAVGVDLTRQSDWTETRCQRAVCQHAEACFPAQTSPMTTSRITETRR